MASPYRKGRTVIPRTPRGTFTRFTLDARVCRKCGAIHLPEKSETLPYKATYPENCRECGEALR